MKNSEIVREYNAEGVRVLICNQAFSGKTEEELEVIRKNARQIAWNIQVGSSNG